MNLPNPIIYSNGAISQVFLNQGINSLWEAIDFVHQLPYGRTTDRSNYLQVLAERRGACSTKHALLAALAKELDVPLKLHLGIILLSPTNMPSIAEILNKYHLKALPEAHCYLKYDNHNLDITFPENSDYLLQYQPLQELHIAPEDIGVFKIQYHQTFLKDWIKENSGLDFETIWEVRETWINGLG
jgi:frataxin-like iron-binding protein CyaY